MKGRGQTTTRIEGVTKSLQELSNSTEIANVNTDIGMSLSLKPNTNKGRRL